MVGIGDDVGHYCTGYHESGGYQGRCEGFMYAIQLNYGVSGTIWGIFVQDTMKVVGIMDDVKEVCTQYS